MMNDSQNKNNNINKRPINTVRKTIEDVECIIGGTIIGAIFLFVGMFTILKNLFMGLIIICISVFPICEIFRGIISLKNKSLINNNLFEQSLELQQQAAINDEKLKNIAN